MKGIHVLILVIFFVSIAPAIAAGQTSSEITTEDLLSAALSWGDIAQARPQTEQWWPNFPEFVVGMVEDTVSDRFYVVQNYTQVNGPSGRKIECALTLYDNDTKAKQAFAEMLETSDKGGALIDGPKLADEMRWYTRTSDSRPYEATVRFRVCNVVGRITTLGSARYETVDELVKLARPVVRRVGWLLDGNLRAKQVPPNVLNLLPPASAADEIGPVAGTAITPIEAWALVDDRNDPPLVRDELYRLGANQLAMRRYNVKAAKDLVVETTLFEFADRASAQGFVKDGPNPEAQCVVLNPSKTGGNTLFMYYPNTQTYDLLFAKGRYIADVCAYAPYAERLPVGSEKVVRKTAEMWYSAIKEQ